jgi:hypothetical protein
LLQVGQLDEAQQDADAIERRPPDVDGHLTVQHVLDDATREADQPRYVVDPRPPALESPAVGWRAQRLSTWPLERYWHAIDPQPKSV